MLTINPVTTVRRKPTILTARTAVFGGRTPPPIFFACSFRSFSIHTSITVWETSQDHGQSGARAGRLLTLSGNYPVGSIRARWWGIERRRLRDSSQREAARRWMVGASSKPTEQRLLVGLSVAAPMEGASCCPREEGGEEILS